MFAIFSLRCPDILPVGAYHNEVSDVVNQSPMSQATSAYNEVCFVGCYQSTSQSTESRYHQRNFQTLPRTHERPKTNQVKLEAEIHKVQKKCQGQGWCIYSNEIVDSDQEVEEEADELPSLNGLPDATAGSSTRHLDQAPMPPPQYATSVLPSVSTTKSDVLGTPLRRDKDRNAAAALTPGAFGLPSMPPPLTPSVTRVLAPAPDAPPPPPFPAGLTVASQKQVG
jgi:hypothetical protein